MEYQGFHWLFKSNSRYMLTKVVFVTPSEGLSQIPFCGGKSKRIREFNKMHKYNKK